MGSRPLTVSAGGPGFASLCRGRTDPPTLCTQTLSEVRRQGIAAVLHLSPGKETIRVGLVWWIFFATGFYRAVAFICEGWDHRVGCGENWQKKLEIPIYFKILAIPIYFPSFRSRPC